MLKLNMGGKKIKFLNVLHKYYGSGHLSLCSRIVFKLNVLLTSIIVYHYSETNVIHFLFNLLRIKGLCMFRALLAHP
jgi:hypothetical protein